MVFRVGKMIKVSAIAVFVVGVLYTVYYGVKYIKTITSYVTYGGAQIILWGILTIILLLIGAAFTALLVYGFGELIDKVCEIASCVRRFQSSLITRSDIDRERKEIMDRLLKKGFISQVEYNKSFNIN